MPIIESTFRPAWWLRGPHLQTLWPKFFRARPRLRLESERLELDDGDFLDLAWHGNRDGRIVVILHGLEGTLDSHYALGLLESLEKSGYRACFMHFRGCSGQANRLPRSYHSGDTADFHTLLEHIRQQYGRQAYAAIGISLGGNVLLKWLGEQGDSAALSKAVAVSVPFQLADAARRLSQGFSRFYQRHLVSSLQEKYQAKFSRMASPLDVDIRILDNFRDFDDRVTAPLHGFDGVDDYYSRSSSRQFIPAIRVPTLILHAQEDPFMYEQTCPSAEELPAEVTLELSPRGGHVGFVEGRWPGLGRYWMDQRILEWLQPSASTD